MVPTHSTTGNAFDPQTGRFPPLRRRRRGWRRPRLFLGRKIRRGSNARVHSGTPLRRFFKGPAQQLRVSAHVTCAPPVALRLPRFALFVPQDTKKDKAWRVVDGAIYVGKVAPLGSTVQVRMRTKRRPEGAGTDLLA